MGDSRSVVKCMENHKVDYNRDKEANDYRVHFSTNRFTSPHLEDALTEIGIFTYLSQQSDRSPFLLKMLGVFADQHHTRLVTEEAEGGELFDVVAQHGPVGENCAARYVSQMLLALQFLQKHNIGHRDVSLENVLLQGGEVRLMDFGQAVQTHSSDGIPLRFFTLAGKKAYRAPEAYVPAHGGTRARIDVPFSADISTDGLRSRFLKLRGLQYLCEVKVPDGATPGSSCDADLMGYTVPPVDVFACGVCVFILCLGFPPWGQATLSNPHFAHFYRQGEQGIPDTIRRYAKSPLSSNLVRLLVDMMRTDPSLRPTVEECLSSSWIQAVVANNEDRADVIMDEDVCDCMHDDPLDCGAVVDLVDSKVEEIVACVVNMVGVQGGVVSQPRCSVPLADARVHLRAISCAGG